MEENRFNVEDQVRLVNPADDVIYTVTAVYAQRLNTAVPIMSYKYDLRSEDRVPLVGIEEERLALVVELTTQP